MNNIPNKELKDKAIKIQGKDYVLVSDRVIYFNETYPNGSIQTELLSEKDAEMVIVKATVYPDVDKPNRVFTGFSQARWGTGMVNKTSALENAETSAVGRALAMMGIGVIESIASADEIYKAQIQQDIARDEAANSTTKEGFGKCARCGAPNKWSEKRQALYCGALCWRKEEKA